MWGYLLTETTGQNSCQDYKNTSIHLCLVVYQLVSVSELLLYTCDNIIETGLCSVYCSVITLVTAYLSTKV